MALSTALSSENLGTELHFTDIRHSINVGTLSFLYFHESQTAKHRPLSWAPDSQIQLLTNHFFLHLPQCPKFFMWKVEPKIFPLTHLVNSYSSSKTQPTQHFCCRSFISPLGQWYHQFLPAIQEASEIPPSSPPSQEIGHQDILICLLLDILTVNILLWSFITFMWIRASSLVPVVPAWVSFLPFPKQSLTRNLWAGS